MLRHGLWIFERAQDGCGCGSGRWGSGERGSGGGRELSFLDDCVFSQTKRLVQICLGGQRIEQLRRQRQRADAYARLLAVREAVGLLASGSGQSRVDLPAHEHTTDRPLLAVVVGHPSGQFVLARAVEALDATLRLRVARTAMDDLTFRPDFLDL